MGLSDPAAQRRVAEFIASAANAHSCEIVDIRRLEGGAIQENHSLDLIIEGGPREGAATVVLRMSGPTGVADSHDRADEFALARKAFDVGVLVPEPLWCCQDISILGKAFSVTTRLPGEARGDILVADAHVAQFRNDIATQLGEELAKVHTIFPDNVAFHFLSLPQNPALSGIGYYRSQLDKRRQSYPALEWGLRWLERNAPRNFETTLVHRDFRVGNFLIDRGRVTGILDWEFAGWGNPIEDIGWLFARCWRFGNIARELGGVADRAPFYQAYERCSGRQIDPDQVSYWELYAHLRWAMIALQQADRYLVGGELNLDAALSGHRLAELETEILRLTAPDDAVAS